MTEFYVYLCPGLRRLPTVLPHPRIIVVPAGLGENAEASFNKFFYSYSQLKTLREVALTGRTTTWSCVTN